jgi:hypothetical protein
MNTVGASTQEHLPIAGIVDDTLIMSDGSLRCVLKVEPINFDLKSETEQNGIIYAYQGFLNSLDFPIQIVIQSKKLELEQYLIRLEQSQKNVANELLRIQIEDYVGFVRRLISVANIMSKRFYIVVSYSPIIKSAGFAGLTSGIFHKQASGPLMDEDEFKRYRAEVHNRGNIIAGGATHFGVKSRTLSTQELIELFYGIYNPDVATEERLTEVETLSAGIISSPTTSQENPGGPSPAYTVPASVQAPQAVYEAPVAPPTSPVPATAPVPVYTAPVPIAPQPVPPPATPVQTAPTGPQFAPPPPPSSQEIEQPLESL